VEYDREGPVWARLDEIEEYRRICKVRLKTIVRVSQPLILISQVQRSGGTFLCQLFDGHPEVHAHPPELKISFPEKTDWPGLRLKDGTERWFEILWEGAPRLHFLRGHRPGPDTFPFLFPPRLQKQIFDRCVSKRPPASAREILDCYFTSYFNAWLDNVNLWTGPKRVVTGFTPRLTLNIESAERYFTDYPDGTLITIVREPGGWYASSKKGSAYRPLSRALDWWKASAHSSIRARHRFGDRVVLITFDQLVLETEKTMGRIAGRIGIAMAPILLEQTFNGRPTRANSSGPVERFGILPERVTAGRPSLDSETLRTIDIETRTLYEQAVELAHADAGAR
jgi:hypothetical protein